MMRTDLLPTARRMLRIREAAMPQKDYFCGPFCAALSVEVITGLPVGQDATAQAAGTLLLSGPPRPSDRAPGHGPRRDYAFDPALCGTSAAGVCRSIDTLSAGRATALAIRGPWHAESLRALLESAMTAEALLILNPATRHWWGTHPGPTTVLDDLDGEDVEPPASDWDVGHFVCVAGRISGRRRELCLIADTYPSLGWGGLYPQPYDRVADGLARPGMPASGGAIIVAEPTVAGELGSRLASAGLDLGLWDNGSGDATLPATSGSGRVS